MNWQTLQKQLTESLSVVYKDHSEAESISDIYIEYLSNLSKLERRFSAQSPSEIQLKQFELDKLRLENQYPIQYLIHKAWFGAYEFYVDESVLIPRPETEELVENIIQKHTGQDNLRILDIGTGSGCIAISLSLHNKNWAVTAIDISENALQIAQKNAQNLNANVSFEKINVLDINATKALGSFDVIVSNPPYIMVEEQIDMQKNVLDFEPHNALFVTNNDPLQFYKAIESLAQNHLTPSGKLYFELNQKFGQMTQTFFKSKGWQTHLEKDMYDNDRLLFCSR